MTTDNRAFVGKRVTVDSEMVLAYADLRGVSPLEAGRMFGAKLVIDRPDCSLKWLSRRLGWECSACGHITRGHQDAPFNFCPFCGAVNKDASKRR